MKRFLIASLLSLTIALGTCVYWANAADMTIQILIPDAYVTKLATMVNAKYMNTNDCGSGVYACSDAQYETQEACQAAEETWTQGLLSVKNCFIKKMIREPIIDQYLGWKETVARQTAEDDYIAAKAAASSAAANDAFDLTGE